MNYFWWISGVLLALIWASRVLDRLIGGAIPDLGATEWDAAPASGPHVTVVVAARNEEAGLAAALASLLRLEYDNYDVVLVNDRSSDRTGEIADGMAANDPNGKRLRVLHVAELPPGWLGKNHALWLGSRQAIGEWLLFTDADILFRPDSLRRVMSFTGKTAADHVVLLITALMETFGERMMLSFFPVIFYFRSRPWAVANPRAKDFVGMGAFNLVRRRAYEGMGTHRALALEVIDDLHLGRLLKRAGYAQRLVGGHDLIRVRWGRGAFGILANLEKNLFAVVQFRVWLALAAVLLALFLNALPWAGLALAPGWARLPFAVAVASVAWIYADIGRFSRLSTLYCLTHAPAAALMCYGMLDSAFRALAAGGVTWRGTKYPLSELRKHSAGW